MVAYCKLASYSNKSLTISHTGTCIYSDTLLEAYNATIKVRCTPKLNLPNKIIHTSICPSLLYGSNIMTALATNSMRLSASVCTESGTKCSHCIKSSEWSMRPHSSASMIEDNTTTQHMIEEREREREREI